MKNNIRGTLGELGYNVELKGAKYVEEVIFQMLGFINNEEEKNKLRSEMILFNEEIDDSLKVAEHEISDAKIIDEMLSRIHVDAYHFEYEIGRLLYLGRINQFLNSNKDHDKKCTDLRPYDSVEKVDVKQINSSIIGLVNYFNEDYQTILEAQEQQEKEESKVYVRRFESIVSNDKK